jgi:hypothetical protein
MRHVRVGLRALAEALRWGSCGAVVAGLLSRTDVEVRAARLVAGAVSGTLVVSTVWLLIGSGDDEVIDLLVTPRDWVELVVVPGLLAVAIGAWRAPRILRIGVEAGSASEQQT